MKFLGWLPALIFYFLMIALVFLFFKDKHQKQHSILKTHPVLGRLRYIFEMIGPELRQYWFSGDHEEKPVDRNTQETIAKASKYGTTVIGFGSTKEFKKNDFYLSNSMFPKNVEELKADNGHTMKTYTYDIKKESLASRKEKKRKSELEPWLLTEDKEIIIGPKRKRPYHLRGLIGVSAMSYGALSKSAVKALSQGVAITQGSFMNTGEGGISNYHLSKVYEVTKKVELEENSKKKKMYDFLCKRPNSSNYELEERFGSEYPSTLQQLVSEGLVIEKSADLIFQVGSGLFGARKDGQYDESVFLKNALRPEVKAIEIKMGQGAKVRGGKLPKEKITPEIAEIRGVGLGKDIESPNRFPLFSNMDELFHLITNWQEITGKPVGIKVVAGSEHSFEELASYMAKTGKHPDFITIDGANGGSAATYQEMADGLGLPIFPAIMILDKTLRKYEVRNDVKIFAAGMLATADKMAIALGLGADVIYVARAAMNTVGCINARKCHTNLCPVGVTSHKPELESGLVVSEKRFRTANYITTMRRSLFMLGASCGIESPTEFNGEHVTFKQENGETKNFKLEYNKEKMRKI